MQRGGRYRNNRGGGGFRGGRGGGGRGGSIQPLKGMFADGIWHCDCSPRIPAEHFKVKKEGRNQGRWFYTCQNRNKGPGDKQGGCDFFLWDEDAKLREEATVMSNSRNEPRRNQDDAQEGWDAGRSRMEGRGLFSSPNKTNGQPIIKEDSETDSSCPPTPQPTGKKRNARDALLDDDEFALTGEEEQELINATPTSSLETPQKAQKTGVYATPATTVKKSSRKLPWIEEAVEPTTPVSTKKTVADYFATPSKSSKTVNFEQPVTTVEYPVLDTPKDLATRAAPTTPSPPSRYKDALINPADSNSSLTNEVLAELSSVKLPPEKLESLRSILTKHDLKTQGVTKGRDISRLALKAKEAKILELEAKINSIEAEREVDRNLIAGLRWKLENGQNDEDDSQL